ncbi:MAG TPA: GspH/FimT family pseudopilin [Trichocoleus sp.]
MKRFLLGYRKAAPVYAGKSGFTLLESAIAITIISTLMAIATPSFLGLLSSYQVTTTAQKTYQAIRMAQQDAIRTRSEWQFSLREKGEYWEWASHPKNLDPRQVSTWEPLGNRVTLDLANTTFVDKDNIYYLRFDYQGDISYRLGRLTFMSRNGGSVRRCVVVSTLIGAMRYGRDQKVPDNSGKYCY